MSIGLKHFSIDIHHDFYIMGLKYMFKFFIWQIEGIIIEILGRRRHGLC